LTRKVVFRPEADIVINPLAFPAIYADTRRAVVRRFPYVIYFRLLAGDIIITAVMHRRRHPRRWRDRQ
jgi:plasmid stabilization system protein ParE